MELLSKIDGYIFSLINQGLSNELFDFFIPWFREKLFWVPLYVFLVVFTFLKFKKKGYIIILSAILCLMISDQLSSKIIKPAVKRERPCNNPEFTNQIHILAPCRNSYSFTSSHATNHFAIGTFFTLLFSTFSKWFKSLYIWASLVCFSQVYVGLHYPFDVLVGGVLGFLIGFLMQYFLKKYFLKTSAFATQT